jgi:hypothetical protein
LGLGLAESDLNGFFAFGVGGAIGGDGLDNAGMGMMCTQRSGA